RGEEAWTSRAESRVKGHRGDAEASGRQDAIGRDVTAEVERAVHQDRDNGAQGSDGNADTEGVMTARALLLSSPDRAARPAEKMRAQEIPAETPDHEKDRHRPKDSHLDDELQEVIVGIARFELARLEHGRLVMAVDIAERAQPNAQEWEGSQHREGREREQPPTRVIHVSDSSQER